VKGRLYFRRRITATGGGAVAPIDLEELVNQLDDRPLAASEDQIKAVRRHRKAGHSLRSIAAEVGLGPQTVRSILKGAERGAGLRKREFDRLRAAAFRARKRGRDQLEKNINETMKHGEALVRAAKGLGR
jgi:predicted transcriptional regulator